MSSDLERHVVETAYARWAPSNSDAALKANWYRPQAYNDVVQKLLRKSRKGARIIYVPGNHDEFLRSYFGTHFGGIEVDRPDSIHIAMEGPIGLMVRRYCRKHHRPVTTSFHTRFPEYVSARLPMPERAVWALLRWFHRPSRAVMAATPALAEELRARGFANVVLWPRGVIGDAPVGALDPDLRSACLEALTLSRQACRSFALERSWGASARTFLNNVVAANRGTSNEMASGERSIRACSRDGLPERGRAS